MLALGEPREERVDALEVLGQLAGGRLLAREGSHGQVLPTLFRSEDPPRLGDERDAAADDRLGGQPVDSPVLELDATSRRSNDAQDRLHRGRLPRSVAAEQAYDLSGAHLESNSLQHPDGARSEEHT